MKSLFTSLKSETDPGWRNVAKGPFFPQLKIGDIPSMKVCLVLVKAKEEEKAVIRLLLFLCVLFRTKP